MTDETPETTTAIEPTDWAAILTREWSEDAVSLSGAVWWIATGGAPAYSDDDELENAARSLLRELRSGKIEVLGTPGDEAIPARVPREHFSIAAAPFTGDLPDDILLSGAATLRWALDIEDDWRSADGDTIEARFSVLWSRLHVRKEDLLAKWPVKQVPPTSAAARGRGRGRPIGVGQRVLDDMRRDLTSGAFDVFDAKEEELATKYRASRDTCRKQRETLKSENAGSN